MYILQCEQAFVSYPTICVSVLISFHLYRKVFVFWIITTMTGVLYCQLKHTVIIPSATLYCRCILVMHFSVALLHFGSYAKVDVSLLIFWWYVKYPKC